MKRKTEIGENSQSDFLRYSRSEMTGQERNAFEKELQKDPFAYEAAEGFEYAGQEEAVNDLNELQKRLRKRTSGNKKLTYYSIAASVAVLMILSSVWLFVGREEAAGPAEKALQEITQMDIPAAEKISEPEPGPGPAPEPASVPIQKEKKIESEQMKEIKLAKQETELAFETAQPAPKGAAEPVEIKSKDALIPAADYSKAAISTAPMMIGGVKREAVAEEAVSYMSDSAGEIVSFSYDSVENKAKTSQASAPAEPIGGREEFDRYAAENIRIPSGQKAGDKKIVVIEFIVTETGEFGQFKVLRSPSKEYASEAERLIKEGPLWKPAKLGGKEIESKVRLRIVF